MQVPVVNKQVSLGVLLAYLVTAILATPAAVSLIHSVVSGTPVNSAAIWAAAVGIAGFIVNTYIHETTSSSGPVAPAPPPTP